VILRDSEPEKVYVARPESRDVFPRPTGKLTGYLAILAGAFLFGMWATVGKFALANVPPITLAWFVQSVTAVAFAPFLGRLRFRRADWARVGVASVLGAVAAPTMYFTGLNLTTPVSAALLSNTEALFTVVFAFVFLRERLSRGGYLAAGAILAGAVVVTLDLGQARGDVGSALIGNVLLVLAAMCWGGANTVGRVVTTRHDIPSFVCMQLSLGSLILAPIVLATGNSLFVPPSGIPIAVFLALGGAALFAYLFYFSMRKIGALQAGAILATSAAFGVAIAVAFDFPLTALQALGGGVMALGVVALYRLASKPSPAKG